MLRRPWLCRRHCISLPTRTLCFCFGSCAASATAFCHWRWPPCLACRNRLIWPVQAFDVTGPQLWNQLPVTTRATSANTENVSVSISGVLFQLTTPSRNSLEKAVAVFITSTLPLSFSFNSITILSISHFIFSVKHFSSFFVYVLD